jgi:uncharacterized protein YhaN
MILRAIRLHDVKRFAGRGIAVEGIPDGLSRLTADNEVGKSTIFESVRLLLQQKHSAGGKLIQEFQPKATLGSPLIEIDIETVGGTYRVTKRFLGRKMARVLDLNSGQIIAQGGDADNWIAELSQAGPKANGPSGLLWVAQGQSMQQPSDNEDVLSSLLENEVGTLVGGQRARVILKRSEEQLASLVTDKASKPTKRYRDSLKQLAVLEEDLKSYLFRRDELDDILSELERTKRSLKIAVEQNQKGELKNKLLKAREKLKTAQQYASELEVLNGKLELANRGHDTAKKEADNFSGKCADLDAFRSELDKAIVAASETTDQLGRAKDRAASDQRAWEEMVGSLRVERQRDRDVVAYERALDASRRSEELSSRFGKAKAVQDALGPLSISLSENRFTNDALTNLNLLATEIVRTSAELKASRPSLAFNLTDKGIEEVRVNEKAIQRDASFTLGGKTSVDLGLLGSIRVDIVDQAALVESDERARQALQSALDLLGVNSLEEARERTHSREESVVRLKELERDLSEYAPDGLTALQDSLHQAEALVPEEFDPDAGPSSPDIDIAELELQERAAQSKRDASRDAHSEIRSKSAATEARLAIAEPAHQEALAQLGDGAKRANQKSNLLQLVEEAGSRMIEAGTAVAEMSKKAPNLELAESAVERFESAIEEAREHRTDLMSTHDKLITRLEAIGDAGLGEKISSADAEIVVLRRRIDGYQREVRSLTLLKDTLSSAQSDLQTTYFEPISNELQPFLNQVIGHGDLRLGDDYGATSLKRSDFSEEIATLSGGTREQIAVLTRLAYAKLMTKQGRPVPVFLDDALVYCDDRRLDEMFTVLENVSKSVQCIVLTCHERLFSTMSGKQLKFEEWSPTD